MIKTKLYNFFITVLNLFSRLEQFVFFDSLKKQNLGDHGFFALVRDIIVLWFDGIMGIMSMLYVNHPPYMPVDFYIGPNKSILLKDAADVHKVFSSKSCDFRGFRMTQERFKNLLGFNLITVHKNDWKDLRHRTMPFLTGRALNRYQEAMDFVMNDRMLPLWRVYEKNNSSLDVWDNMLLYSSKVVFMAFMGLKAEEVPQNVHFLLNQMFHLFRQLLLAVFNIPRWIPTPTNIAFNGKMRTVRRFIRPYIHKQKTMNTMLGSIIKIIAADIVL